MIVVDSSALVAILRREPEADLDALVAREAMPQDQKLVETARKAFLRYGKGRLPAPLTW